MIIYFSNTKMHFSTTLHFGPHTTSEVFWSNGTKIKSAPK